MKAVILDMYGVVTTEPNANLAPFLHGYFPGLDRDYIYSLWSRAMANEIATEDFWKGMGFDGDIKQTERAYLDTIAIDPRFWPAAATIRERFRLALLSNDISEWSAYLRTKHGLDKWFDEIIISGDMGCKKPGHEIYQIMLDRLSLPPEECAFVDDRAVNIKAAGELGFVTVTFDRGGADYPGRTVTDFEGLIKFLNTLP